MMQILISPMLTPQAVVQMPLSNCMPSDALSIPHKYYHLGDLIIGGIISQIYITSGLITFTSYPHWEEIEDLMWTWIGVIHMPIKTSEVFVHSVLPLFSQKGICFAFIAKFPKMTSSNNIVEVMEKGMGLFNIAMTSTANVLVVHSNTETIMILRMLLHGSIFENRPVKKKIWIMTAQMEFTSLSFQRDWDLFIHGAICFAIHSAEVPGFQEFLRRRNPQVEKEDGFIKDFWKDIFMCMFHDSVSDRKAEKICTGEEKLETLPGSVFEMSMNGHSYSVYNAVYAVAHAVHAMRLSTFRQRNPMNGETWKLNQPPWQLHHFLRNVSFNNTAGEEVSFDQNGELIAGFDVINWVTFPNQSFLRVRVGRIDPKAPPNNIFTIREDAIVWPRGFNQCGYIDNGLQRRS
uniref:Uncharacterized protein n=1 Tax=Sphaerodactylus townsendi TaxID=933632 RepID=A0ACB8FTA7_9SAUR